MNAKMILGGLVIAALIIGFLYYGIGVFTQNYYNTAKRMTGEDLKTFVPGDQWKWHIEAPIHLTGSTSGDIYLHIDAWGNYTTVIDYDINSTIEKAYYVSLEGWGLGDGYLNTSYGSFNLKVNNDSSSGQSGYDSNVPFRVLGHRIVRVSDLADLEVRVYLPDAWVHVDAGLLGYDEMEFKMDSNLTFWNETRPYVPDNMDFPINVGEKMWYNTSLHTWGYTWNGNDSQGYVSEKNSTFDNNATWNYTFDYPTYHDVTVGAGTFSCYNATGTNATGGSHIYLEYAPELKWYAKEVYQNINVGNGTLTLDFNVTSYNIKSSSNTLSLSSNEITQGDPLTINGTVPDAPNSSITIAIPEHGLYYNTTSDSSGKFSYKIDRYPLLNDTTHTSIDYGSVGIVAYPSDNASDLCVETLTIHKLPSHVIYGYVKVGGLNLNNTTISITNMATGDNVTIVPNNTTGYYEIDISYLPHGYRNGEEIKGVLLLNGTPTQYSNTTTIDTSVSSQRMDITSSSVPEFSNYLLSLLMVIPIIVVIRKRRVIRG